MPAKPEKRLRRELDKMQKEPIPGCCARLRGNGDNIFEWEAFIEGPKDSVYENGLYRLTLTFPSNYPIKPPQVLFKTKIYHCNIADSGAICLDVLKHNWSPILTINKILLSIVSLLTDPNPDDPLVGSVAREYKTNRKNFEKTAKEWTKLYAKGNLNDYVNQQKK